MRIFARTKKIAAWALTLCLCAAPAFSANDEREEDRVRDAGEVMKEILNIPDDIPQDLLDKAECVVILPSVKKGAFGIGGSYGRGVMICRSGEHYTGPWGPPAMYALEGVSIGFQLGGQATDFVLLVMNPRGARSLLSSKVKLGADASAAAGPKGRTAEGATDACLPEYRSKAQPCDPTAAPMKISMARSWMPRTSLLITKSRFLLARKIWSRCWMRNHRRTNRIRSRLSSKDGTWL